ncbi:uncharacterized protein STEHIDRAFT_172131 [Stereum hirsutum FP-91666 SS1]|uniref:uncharacterized protein n=1 Tax=Stereum hirsutum (strain FP-91666) TaxID=721885 RepID=UPI0004449347|nr:uncharacterized protein STEHIDRAFT_172131 [Stereum hirsutum FP-91666 SS1]EIM81100.1 hypothetical protein STEHIDRAFT_172131 [Stereum hirsutum FP-91666 SS1]
MPRRKTCQPLRASPVNSSKSISSTPRENAMKLRPDSLRFKENGLPMSPQDHIAATDPLPKLRDYVRCPKCNARLLLKNLERHRNKMHEYTAPPPPRTLSVGLRPQTLYVRLRPPRRVRPPFRRAPPPRPGSLVRCHACNRHILEKSLKKHRQRVHGKKAAVGRTGRKGTPNCPENNSKGISRKAQARLGDPSVTYVPSSPPKSYVTREMRGDNKSSPNSSKSVIIELRDSSMFRASRRQFTPAEGSTNHASAAGPPNQPNLPEYVDCPSCKSKVLSKKLDRHRRRQHGHPAPPAVNAVRPSRHDMPGVWLPALSARIVPFPRAPPPPQTYVPPQTSSALSTPTPGAEPLPQAVSRIRTTLPGSPPVYPPSTARTVRTASVHGLLPVRGVPAARAPQTRILSVVLSAPFRATPPPPVVPSLHGEISAQATPARGVTPVHTGPLSHNNSSGRIFVRCDVCKTRLLTKNLERHKARTHGQNEKAPTSGRKKVKAKAGTKPKGKAKTVDLEPKHKVSPVIQGPSRSSYSEPKTYGTCTFVGYDIVGLYGLTVTISTSISKSAIPIWYLALAAPLALEGVNYTPRITKSKCYPSPRLRWTRSPTSKQQLKLPECKRCAHGFRGYRELSEHYQETHSET